MASIVNTVGAPCASPVLTAIPQSGYGGARREILARNASSPSSVSFARGIPPKARLRSTAMAATGATQTQTVERKSTRIPNGIPSKVVGPQLDQGGGGFPPYRGGGGGGGGGGGDFGKSSGGFVLFSILMFLDYLKEVEKKWFKFDDDDYYNQLSF